MQHAHRSDHSIIELQIQLNKFHCGLGTWKINSSILKDKSYVELINKTIEQTIEEYSLPTCNPLKNHDISTKDLTLTIDDTLFLDTFLMKIRGKTIHVGSPKKIHQNEREKN